jgi:hypothetical protein
MCLTRACCWLAFPSLLAAEAQTALTTTQASAASATFAYVSDDGCVQNEVMVFATRTTAVSAKARSTTAAVTYSRHRYDYCQDSDLGTDGGTSSQLEFSGDLNRSSLNATINGHTASGSAVTVSFGLVWEGKGSITRQAGRSQNTRVGSPKLIRSENLIRNAVVRGTMDERDISDAMVGANLSATQNTITR